MISMTLKLFKNQITINPYQYNKKNFPLFIEKQNISKIFNFLKFRNTQKLTNNFKMISIKQISNLSQPFKTFLHFKALFRFGSKHRVFQLKNNSMLIIEDANQQLPYMAEVQLENGSKGIVMKLQQSGKAYIGMYEQVNTQNTINSEIEIANIKKNWRFTTKQLSNKIKSSALQHTGIYDVNQNILQKNSVKQGAEQNPECYQILNGSKRRIKTSSPILNACYDLYCGDMISFMGCRGSKKSENARNIAREFSQNKKNSLTIYVNPYFKQAKELSVKNPSSYLFTVAQHKKPTDIGVYMLALKAINLSKELKKQGFDVLLIVDNLNDIMLREWSMLQSIKFNSKVVNSTKLFQFNSLKISPISILNQIYSACQDNLNLKQSSSPKQSSQQKGSLTSILISQRQNNELLPEITSYSNNLKHLQTLSQVIQFPLNFKINSNTYYQKPKNEQELETMKAEQGYYEKQVYRFFRAYINMLLKERQETQLKRQLYKNDMRDAPWDYFFLLDAEWWANGVKDLGNNAQSFKETIQFLKWITYSIQHDYVGHWNLTAKQSFYRFMTFLKNQRNLDQKMSNSKIQFDDEDMQAFVEDAKMQDLINPFKKDYLT